MEVSRELGRSYDFLVEYRKESVNTPAIFRVRGDGDKNHRTQARYRQEATKWELLESGFEKIAQRLDKLEKEVQDDDKRESLRKLRGYLDNHKTRLGYRERLSEGRAIGSGQVEGACKSMIGRRLKQTNAQWNVDRLNEMAVLCSVHYSDL